MKRVTYVILILTISFGGAPGAVASSARFGSGVRESIKISSVGKTSFSRSSLSLYKSENSSEKKRSYFINTNKNQDADNYFKFHSFRNEEEPEEENRPVYFARAPPKTKPDISFC